MSFGRSLFCAAAAVGLIAAIAGSAIAGPLDVQIWVDVDGTAYLHNTTAGPVRFDGYLIASEAKNLDPAGWDSIADRVPGRINELIAALGDGALTFGEANPGSANLAELSLSSVGILAGGAKFSLGKPFKDLQTAVTSDQFFWKGTFLGDGPSDIVLAPEPSTWLLATLAALGCVAMRRRRVTR